MARIWRSLHVEIVLVLALVVVLWFATNVKYPCLFTGTFISPKWRGLDILKESSSSTVGAELITAPLVFLFKKKCVEGGEGLNNWHNLI